MDGALMRLKRLLRPLVPDRLMARYRLHQHSRQVRVAVDVLLEDRAVARRWLSVLPDTYRVVVDRDAGLAPAPAAYTALGAPDQVRTAAAALAARGVDAVVAGRTPAPSLVGRRRVEPPIEPTAIAVWDRVLEDVGGVPSGDDLGALLHRLRDAGHRLALIPTVTATPLKSGRFDPIDRPAAVILGAVPMHDVGGGSRGAQLAMELVAQGLHVVYVSLFGTHESVDLGTRFVHPELEQHRAGELDPGAVAERARAGGFVLVEIPAPDYLPVAAAFQAEGWGVVYDIVDLWSDAALGGEWYRPEAERDLIDRADLVIGSASDLLRGPAAGRTDALLVPNGVNPAFFAGDPGPAPPDLPAGTGPLLGYHGSLYGDWFDWGAVSEVARELPEARVVLIGDVPRSVPELPGNVSLLGLKPQAELLGYVARFDVGLLPFRVTQTTHSVSPLKVFEYLAAGVPVAAVPLRSLEGLDVTMAARLVDAVRTALAGDPPDRARALVEHSWGRRVETLLEGLAVEAPDGGSPVRVVRRPVTHHPRDERLVT